MDQNGQKPEAPEIVVQSRFLRWLDNIWYHYKWHIIIGAFAIFTLVVCLVQCSSRKSYDVTVSFAGGAVLNDADQNGICAAMEAVLPEDFGEGETPAVQLVTYGIYPEDELLALYSSEKADGVRVIDDYAYGNAKKQNLDESNSFSTFIKTGECSVWFVSPYVYERYEIEKLAVPLSEIFNDATPKGAANAYAVRLGDTAFYQTYSALYTLPADTLIVLTRPYAIGRASKEAYYGKCLETFLSIVNFDSSK